MRETGDLERKAGFSGNGKRRGQECPLPLLEKTSMKSEATAVAFTAEYNAALPPCQSPRYPAEAGKITSGTEPTSCGNLLPVEKRLQQPDRKRSSRTASPCPILRHPVILQMGYREGTGRRPACFQTRCSSASSSASCHFRKKISCPASSWMWNVTQGQIRLNSNRVSFGTCGSCSPLM